MSRCKEAAVVGYASLLQTGVDTVVRRPIVRKVLSMRWGFIRKIDGNRRVAKHNAGLVAR